MKLSEALNQVPRSHGEPLIRQCCECKVWLDEASEVIASSRDQIKYTISHGLCEQCCEKLYPED